MVSVYLGGVIGGGDRDGVGVDLVDSLGEGRVDRVGGDRAPAVCA